MNFGRKLYSSGLLSLLEWGENQITSTYVNEEIYSDICTSSYIIKPVNKIMLLTVLSET